MLKPFLAVILAVAVFFGGTGATVYAAQGCLPDQALYPVKIWSEDALVSLAGSSQVRLKYDLDFSDRRITEMAGMLSAGNPVPEMVITRLQNELQQALELAAGTEDPQMLKQLEQIHLRAEAQLQAVTALMAGVPESDNPVLLQVQTRLQEQVQLALIGQTDPQEFRIQVQQRQHNLAGSGEQTPGSGNDLQGSPTQNPVGTPLPSGPGYGSQSPDQTPQTGNGPQGSDTQNPADTLNPTGNGNGSSESQPTGTPGQYGPGSPLLDCTPRSGTGSGKGP